MKLTHARVFSALLLLTIVVSSLIFLSENAIQFVYWLKYFSRHSVKNINESMNDENEELNRLKFQMDTINETSIESRISDFSRRQNRIKSTLEVLEPFESYAKYVKPEKLYFFTYMKEAENIYKKCIKYLKMNVDNTTICSFANAVTSNDEGELGDILRRIKKYVLPETESLPYGNFFGPMRNALKEREARGSRRDLSQQMIYEMYELLIQNEKIAYLVFKLSHSTLTKCSQGVNSEIYSSKLLNHEDSLFPSKNHTDEIESAHKEILRRIQKYRELILLVIADLPREEQWGVPIQLYSGDKSVIKINRVVELMSDNCRSTCRNISEKMIPRMTLYSGDIMNITSCDTCRSVNSSQHCRKPPRFSTGKSERYSSSQTFDRIVVSSLLCDRSLSKEKEVYVHKHDYHCDDCVCECKKPDVTIKYPYAISLRAQESDIADNMIVTGIRFHKTENPDGIEVIYPQIKVAKLSPEGLSGEVWKDVGNFDNGSWPSGEVGVDYATIGSGENRSMIITSDINSGKLGYVVTGVKFELRYNRYREKKYEGDVEKSFEIVLRLTPCNFTTAYLSASESIYTDPDAEMTSAYDDDVESKMLMRTHVETTHKNILMNGEDATTDRKVLQYVEITHSSELISSKRLAASNFDHFSVETTPAIPLFSIDLTIRRVSWNDHTFEFKVRPVNLEDMMEWQRYKNLSLIQIL